MLIKGTKRQDTIAIGIACNFLENCSWEVQMWKNAGRGRGGGGGRGP